MECGCISPRSAEYKRIKSKCLTHTLSCDDRPYRGRLRGQRKSGQECDPRPVESCGEGVHTPGSACRPCRGAVCEAPCAPETLEETYVRRVRARVVRAEAPGQAGAARGGRHSWRGVRASAQSRHRPREECSEHLTEVQVTQRASPQVRSPVHARAFHHLERSPAPGSQPWVSTLPVLRSLWGSLSESVAPKCSLRVVCFPQPGVSKALPCWGVCQDCLLSVGEHCPLHGSPALCVTFVSCWTSGLFLPLGC